jgi:hypothetical protein
MSQLNELSLTSDREYLKIWGDGYLTISANGTPDADSTFPADPNAPFGFSGSVVIPHPLNSVPLVRAFWDPDKNGRFYGEKNAFKDPWLKVIPSISSVKLIMNTDGAAKLDIPVYYRIYDLGNVAATSDSAIDKIFKKDKTSGSVGASANSLDITEATISIPHPAGERPLYTVQFSEDQQNWYAPGTKIVGPFDTTTGPPGGPYSRYFYTSAYCYTDAFNLYVVLQNNYATSKTLYVRFALDYMQ